jgi:predicted nucleic acid-binding Zn ribbon protein
LGGSEPDQCPACNAAAVCRLMSTCGFVAKGSGGQTVSKSASSSSCTGCSSSSCAGCGH